MQMQKQFGHQGQGSNTMQDILGAVDLNAEKGASRRSGNLRMGVASHLAPAPDSNATWRHLALAPASGATWSGTGPSIRPASGRIPGGGLVAPGGVEPELEDKT